jgi:hypothetical protein|tara:strand:- start:476 stop:697 length:222 start_codon:yes stop_codon:yes gene_type:complete
MINNFKIEGEFKTPKEYATRPGKVIMAKNQSRSDEWVVAWLGDGDKQWSSGWYSYNKTDAINDFFYRCKGINK